MSSTKLPDSNPKSKYGIVKDPLHLIPPEGLVHEAGAFRQGAEKYGAYNWRQNSVAASVYYAAALRHLTQWWDGQDLDPESGAHHLGHARACLAIVLDSEKWGKLIDDRPLPDRGPVLS